MQVFLDPVVIRCHHPGYKCPFPINKRNEASERIKNYLFISFNYFYNYKYRFIGIMQYMQARRYNHRRTLLISWKALVRLCQSAISLKQISFEVCTYTRVAFVFLQSLLLYNIQQMLPDIIICAEFSCQDFIQVMLVLD